MRSDIEFPDWRLVMEENHLQNVWAWRCCLLVQQVLGADREEKSYNRERERWSCPQRWRYWILCLVEAQPAEAGQEQELRASSEEIEIKAKTDTWWRDANEEAITTSIQAGICPRVLEGHPGLPAARTREIFIWIQLALQASWCWQRRHHKRGPV